MGLAVLINRPAQPIAHQGPIVKRDDYAALLDAQALMRKTEDEARALLAQARQRYEAARRSGYDEGFAQARAEAAACLAAAAAAQAHALAGLEARIVGVVMRAVRGILQEIDEQTLFEQALRRARALLKGETPLTLRVCPRQEASAQAAVQAIAQALGAPECVAVQADDTLAMGACIIASDSASIDASLDTQLAAIERALHAQFAQGSAAACA